jgi:SAM-dependent methyltransferase
MAVEESYFAVSRFFAAWVWMMEYHTRRMEALDSAHLGSRRLIISPPTDAGIPLLAGVNAHGTTELLCFSDRLERTAVDHRKRLGLDALVTQVEPFFSIPASDEVLSVVYANCLFDFCEEADFDPMFHEIWRVLEPGGVLCAVYIGPPSSYGGRLWAWILHRFRFLGNGCHPVSIGSHLTRRGFRIRKDTPAIRLGLSIRYTVAEKPADVA